MKRYIALFLLCIGVAFAQVPTTITVKDGTGTTQTVPTLKNSETALQSIDGKTPALGQALAAGSVPVVLTAAQLSAITPAATQAVSAASLPLPTGAATETTLAAVNTKLGSALPLPTGAATAAKQPALGTAGVASTDVITVQGIASGVAQPVSQSGSWSFSSSTAYTQGSTTSGQSGALHQAAVTTAAPSYTTGQTSPLSLNVSGGLRVDGSGVTQPVSGTFWQATQPVSISGNQAINNAQVNGVTISVGSGTSDTGTQRVTINTDTDLTLTGATALTATVNNILPNAATSAIGSNFSGFKSAMVQVTSTGTGGTYIFEACNDDTNYVAVPVWNQLILTGTPITAAVTATSSTIGYTFPIVWKYYRLRIATTITGGSITAITTLKQAAWTPPNAFQIAQATAANLNVTATGTLTAVTTLANGQTAHSSASTGSPLRAGGRVNTTLDTTLVQGDTSDLMMTDAGQVITKDYGSASNDWSYAAATLGILNTTTAVTVKAAGAASIRNYVTSVQIQAEVLGTATEFAIRDGAAGTVLWRFKIGTAGCPLTTIVFPSPLRGTAATLLEVVTLTASTTGAVYVNLQGYQSF